MWSLWSRKNLITNENLFFILNFGVDIFNRPKLVLFWMLAKKEKLKICLETISPSLAVSLLSPFCLLMSFLPPYHTLKHPLPHPHKLTHTPTPSHTHTHTHTQTYTPPSVVQTSLQEYHATENQFWFCRWDQLTK